MFLGSLVVCIVPNGFYPNPTDCQKYFQCGHGRPYAMTCALGTLWNAQLKYCDWPSNVQCNTGSTTGPATSGSTQSTTARTSKLTDSTSTSPTTAAGCVLNLLIAWSQEVGREFFV